MPSSYSKAQVDSAGRTLADFASLQKLEREKRLKDPVVAAALLSADDVINWWRREHAYPLTKVNAGLRHYLAPYGPAKVTQRSRSGRPSCASCSAIRR